MGDHQGLFLRSCHIAHHCVCHLLQTLTDADALPDLLDPAVHRACHNGLDAQSRCNQCLDTAESAVFTQSFQIIQDKIRIHLTAKRFQTAYHLFKGKSLFLQGSCQQRKLCLSAGSRTGIHDVNLFGLVLFQIHLPPDHGTVIASAQIAGQRYHINMLCLRFKRLPIALRRRTGGTRALGT